MPIKNLQYHSILGKYQFWNKLTVRLHMNSSLAWIMCWRFASELLMKYKPFKRTLLPFSLCSYKLY